MQQALLTPNRSCWHRCQNPCVHGWHTTPLPHSEVRTQLLTKNRATYVLLAQPPDNGCDTHTHRTPSQPGDSKPQHAGCGCYSQTWLQHAQDRIHAPQSATSTAAEIYTQKGLCSTWHEPNLSQTAPADTATTTQGHQCQQHSCLTDTTAALTQTTAVQQQQHVNQADQCERTAVHTKPTPTSFPARTLLQLAQRSTCTQHPY
jgi:hypothetical protein